MLGLIKTLFPKPTRKALFANYNWSLPLSYKVSHNCISNLGLQYWKGGQGRGVVSLLSGSVSDFPVATQRDVQIFCFYFPLDFFSKTYEFFPVSVSKFISHFSLRVKFISEST